MSRKVLVVTLTEASNLAAKIAVLERKLAAAQAGREKERRKRIKKQYKIRALRSRPTNWEISFYGMSLFRKQAAAEHNSIDKQMAIRRARGCAREAKSNRESKPLTFSWERRK